ncbi:MAG TPA: helix-turn-helix domain-containing protein [Ardenticatenaceae bacterium]|nr:helix-turn-helix domain-containing protein [Ardenticatenaceae bacterium]
MNDPVALLQQLGFGDYEARAYVALLQRSPLNGYELAKGSGIPRANIYAILQKLEERGAVVRLDTAEGARYAPIPATELTQRLVSRFQDVASSAQRALNEITSPAEHDYVWNARGYSVLLTHARSVIDSAQEQLSVAIWRDEAVALAENLALAEERGVRMTTLCQAGCSSPCGGCRGLIYRERTGPDQDSRWLVLVPDNAEVLAGQIGAGNEALVVRTRQPLLVDLASCYIPQGIALAAVLSDLAGRLEQVLGPETLAILESVGIGSSQGDVLQPLRWLPGSRHQQAHIENDARERSEADGE